MPLSNPFRRDATRPTLRQRAAGLKATAARVVRKPKPLPEPASPEAMTQWQDASRKTDRLTDFLLTDYPELKRTPLEWWTMRTIGEAVEAGEITPAEGARLYPIASERELRAATVAHRLNAGPLFFLAHAGDYPLPPAGLDDDGSDADLVALGQQFDVAAARERDALDACAAADRRNVNEPALEADLTQAANAAAALARRVASLPATTAAGFRAKLRALRHYDPAVFPVSPPQEMSPEQELGQSLRRDLERQNATDPAPGLRADPIFAAIHAHVDARRAMSEAADATDLTMVRERGGDTSGPAMAQARDAASVASTVEGKAWENLFEVHPTTIPGLLTLIQHVADWEPALDGLYTGYEADFMVRHFGALAENLDLGVAGPVPPQAAPVPPATRAWATLDLSDPDTVAAAIMAEWPRWVTALAGLPDDAGDDAVEAVCVERDRLLDAAEALPPTVAAIVPKALALAWLDLVVEEMTDKPRDGHTLGGRYALDVQAALMGSPPPANVDAELLDIGAKLDAAYGRGQAAPTHDKARKETPAAPAPLNPNPDLREAIKAYHDAVAAMGADPDPGDATIDRHSAAIEAAGARIRAIPARGFGDVQAKARLLWPHVRPDVNGDDWRAFLDDLFSDVERVARPDLSAFTICELARTFETVSALSLVAGSFVNAPFAWDGDRHHQTPAGDLLEAEADRFGDLLQILAEEIRSRTPADRTERNERLSTLAVYETACGPIQDRELVAEIAAAAGV